MKKYSLNNGYVGSDQRQSIGGTTGVVKNFILRKANQLTKFRGFFGNASFEPGVKQSYSGTGTVLNSLNETQYSASLENGVAFNVNGYFELDGSNDWIKADSAISIVNQNQCTIEIALLPTVDGYSSGPGGRVIWSSHDINYGNNYIFHIVPTTGQVGKISNIDITTNDAAGTLGGEWKIVHFVKDGTNWDIYINGEYNASTSISNYTGGSRLSFGQEWDSSNTSDYYNGDMGGIHLFNTKLTAAEIAIRASIAAQNY